VDAAGNASIAAPILSLASSLLKLSSRREKKKARPMSPTAIHTDVLEVLSA